MNCLQSTEIVHGYSSSDWDVQRLWAVGASHYAAVRPSRTRTGRTASCMMIIIHIILNFTKQFKGHKNFHLILLVLTADGKIMTTAVVLPPNNVHPHRFSFSLPFMSSLLVCSFLSFLYCLGTLVLYFLHWYCSFLKKSYFLVLLSSATHSTEFFEQTDPFSYK